VVLLFLNTIQKFNSLLFCIFVSQLNLLVMTTITVHPEDASQIEAVKAIMKALKIKFEVSKEKPYNPDFVAKIKRSEEDFKNGKFTSVKVEDLGKYIDNL
jgi:hypothetical protein